MANFLSLTYISVLKFHLGVQVTIQVLFEISKLKKNGRIFKILTKT